MTLSLTVHVIFLVIWIFMNFGGEGGWGVLECSLREENMYSS